MIVYLNGEWLPEEQAAIPVHDRGLLFGDGVFETGLLYRGGYFRLRPHLQRLQDSAAALRLEPPPVAALEEIARELAHRNDLRDGSLRITLTRGTGARPTVLATLQPLDPQWRARAERGWSLMTARTRRPSTAAVPAQLKALGRTYALLARLEAADAGADDALLLTDEGFVCEGPTWNIFWRVGDILFTPELDLGVLAGVTRTILAQLAPAQGLALREGRFPLAALDAAEEVFATMTSVGIVSIRQLDGRHLPEATPAADRLRPAYWAVVAAEAAGAE